MRGYFSYECNLQLHRTRKKCSGLKQIQTYHHRDTGAVIQQLSDQPNWELVSLVLKKIPLLYDI